MTRTISLITATAAALLLAAPAAGDNWGADRNSDPVGYLSPDSADRAAALEQQRLAGMLDAREKSQAAKLEAQVASTPSPDVFERAAAAAASVDSTRIVVDDRFDLHRQFVPTTVAAATSSRWDLEPGQIGLGLGLGILLAIGLFLAVRFTRVHRLAH